MFIAVGAGHLIGEYGLISLLKKEGYLVEPVTGNDEI
ncbi:MAG: TraB/GumN family protein [Bacteroidales bacterium]|nr:TraB/GumN family protein [Bacteroidales bacterium]